MRRKQTRNGQNKAGLGKVVIGLVVGSVVGATVGLLIAPASGEDTRRKIKGEAKDTAGSIEEKSRELIGEARDEFDSVRKSIVERVTRRKKSASS
ncbi:MAG TPA: YtxH domain-containing protein [Anaerolineales bacterium]|nr:YtxH domain-containing protein [Anaerolineales bacterium]